MQFPETIFIGGALEVPRRYLTLDSLNDDTHVVFKVLPSPFFPQHIPEHPYGGRAARMWVEPSPTVVVERNPMDFVWGFAGGMATALFLCFALTN